MEFLLGIVTDALFLCLLLWCTLSDLKRRIIPNPAIALMLLAGIAKTAFFIASGGMWYVHPLGRLAALPFIFTYGKHGVGGGDVKLMAAAGLYLGIWEMTPATFGTLIFLSILSVIRLAKRKSLKVPIPLAPAIAVGCSISILIDITFSIIQ